MHAPVCANDRAKFHLSRCVYFRHNKKAYSTERSSMNRYYDDTILNMGVSLKMDTIGGWIERDWLPAHPIAEPITMWVSDSCVHEMAIGKFKPDFELPQDYRYAGLALVDCPVIVRVSEHIYDGELTYRSGAFVYTFTRTIDGVTETQTVLVAAARYTDDGRMVALAHMPRAFVPVWTEFSKECDRLVRELNPSPRVMIIGGRTASFETTIDWEEVILPEKLKSDLLHDVESFFTKGINVYKRLNLKPFRKLLLAGVPGTGKTMLCSALAAWALERQYLVIYISSADHMGASFGKIQQALHAASCSNHPTLILLEELDAFLHEQEKALVLNVMDGSESTVNDQGTLLIATTNYPEAIDERVLKRPGRLDRVFIIPETKREEDAERILAKYLGEMWQDDHRQLVARLVGYPGAFIREVAVYALTQVAFQDMDALPFDLLENSFLSLRDQIEARDDFLHQRASVGFSGNNHSR